LFDERYSTRALLLFEARLLLRRWDDAEGTFARYPHFIEGAVLADAQARLRLGRGDADGAWAALGAAVDGEPDVMRLTRARVLAALGRSPDEVFRLLATQPRDALQAFARRHALQRRALIHQRYGPAARRLADVEGELGVDACARRRRAEWDLEARRFGARVDGVLAAVELARKLDAGAVEAHQHRRVGAEAVAGAGQDRERQGLALDGADDLELRLLGARQAGDERERGSDEEARHCV
jgi:hypothetical protein